MSDRARGAPSTLDAELRDVRRVPTWTLAVIVLGATVYLLLFVQAILEADTDLIQGLTIAPILVAATVPIALRIARRDGDPTLAAIVLAAVVAKLVFAWVRYWVAWDYYGASSSDSLQYHLDGSVLAPSYRGLDFSPNVGELTGTGFVKMVTGIVYAIVGSSPVAGFFVFAWIAFLGLLLMSRAFKIGVPSGDARRYLVLVLFLPSLLYWPSSIGKEAWMTMALGLCAYGVAALFARRPNAIPMLVVGFLAVGAVRPHIGLIVFIGLALAALLRRAPARTYAAPFLRLMGVSMLVVAGVAIIGQTTAFLELETKTSSLADQRLDIQDATTDGGSAFTPIVVNTPIDMAPAAITIFFRPFPFEAGSPPELASAAEGALLLLLLFASRNRLRSIPRLIRTTPYVTFCIGYLLAFVFAFSSFANFGILARQRTQALPFLLVFLAVPRFVDLMAATASGAQHHQPQAASSPGSAPTTDRPRPRRRRTVTASDPTVATTGAVATERRGRRRRPAATPEPTVGVGAARRRAHRSADRPSSPTARTRTAVSSGAEFAPPPKAR